MSAGTPAGLDSRLIAGERLRDVLGGAHFSPFSAEEVAHSRDRALANRLVTTALRRAGHIDIVMGKLLERGLPGKSGSFEVQLRLALAQLLFMPEIGAHSVLFLAVEAIKRDKRAAHLAKLANAVLRRAQAEAASFAALPMRALFSETQYRRWAATYGDAAVDAFGAALLAGAPLDLTLRDNDAALVAALGGEALLMDTVRIADRDRPVDALPGYVEGRWWVQDVAASLPARLIELPPGARVLDLCAAPGGKTAQLAKAGFSVTAVDNDGRRIDRLRQNLARLGYAAEVVEADAATYAPAQVFDAVLLDAPCSATGTFRRHPEVIRHGETGILAGRVALQRKLLAHALALVRPGGTLVYCVCSLEPEEGEEQARWALDAFSDLGKLPIAAGEIGGLAAAVTAEGFVRTHPGLAPPGGAGGGMDGFFVARFRRA